MVIRTWKQKLLRDEVLKRDNFTCVKCGFKSLLEEKGTRHYDNFELIADHIIPLTLNGIDNLDNMQTLCLKCNKEKNAKDQSNIAKFKREKQNGKNI